MIKVIEKYKTVPAAARAALWFVFASMLQKAMAFITVPIFTRIMDTAQYGLYSTYLSWSSIFTVLLTLRLESGAYTNVLGKVQNREQHNNILYYPMLLCNNCCHAASCFISFFYDSIDWSFDFYVGAYVVRDIFYSYCKFLVLSAAF